MGTHIILPLRYTSVIIEEIFDKTPAPVIFFKISSLVAAQQKRRWGGAERGDLPLRKILGEVAGPVDGKVVVFSSCILNLF